jgi:hypothetical protein
MKEATEVTHIESRWQVVLAIVAIFFFADSVTQSRKGFPYLGPIPSDNCSDYPNGVTTTHGKQAAGVNPLFMLRFE